MAKRFISTELFDDNWFMELSIPGKLLWVYFITKCDHAGFIKINHKLCTFQTGIKDIPKTIQELGKRWVRVEEDFYFVPKFLLFQYPGFPKSGAPQQQGAIKLLERYGLYKDGVLTVTQEYETVTQDLPKSNVYGKGDVDKEIKVPEFSEFLNYAKTLAPYKPELDFSLEAKYNAWVANDWKDGHDKKIKIWKTKLQNTIVHLAPMSVIKSEREIIYNKA